MQFQAGASAAPPGNEHPAPGACFCPVAAAPYRDYELRQMSRKGRPAQAQRRPAMGIRRQAPVLPGGGCALPGLRTATNVTER